MIRISFAILIASLLVASGSAEAPCAGHDDGSCSAVEQDSSTLLQSKAKIDKVEATTEEAYILDDSKDATAPFAVGTRGCQGVGECQFTTRAAAEDFCNAEDTCVAVCQHPAGNNCAGGLGCFTPRGGLVADGSFAAAGGHTYVKQQDDNSNKACQCVGGSGYGQECTTADADFAWCYVQNSAQCSDAVDGSGGWWSKIPCQAYDRYEAKTCVGTPYTYNLAVGCNGWHPVDEATCWQKCVDDVQAPNCPQQPCVAMKVHTSTGWCHLFSSCASTVDYDSDVILRVRQAPAPAPTTPAPVTCTCLTPNAGSVDQNQYTCTDGTTSYCAAWEICYAELPFVKGQWQDGCEPMPGGLTLPLEDTIDQASLRNETIKTSSQ